MLERSPEIEQLIRDTNAAMNRSDFDLIERQTSSDPCVLSIGSDATEWAEGHDEIMRLLRDFSPGGDTDMSASLDDVKAFREGNVGWVAARGSFEVDGKRIPVRLTGVAHQEDGEWKAVQTHASIGVPNEHMLDPMFGTQ